MTISRSEGKAFPLTQSKSVAQGLGKGTFCADILEFVAFFLLGAGRVGIGHANVPEGIFGKHHAKRRAHGGLERLAGFENFNVELFAHGKGTVLHHAVEDDAHDLYRVCCCRAGNGLRGTCRPLRKSKRGRQGQQKDDVRPDFQQTIPEFRTKIANRRTYLPLKHLTGLKVLLF